MVRRAPAGGRESQKTWPLALSVSRWEFTSPDWALLRNAVAEPVRQLIAVEVDSPTRARAAIKHLTALNASLPSHTLVFDANTMAAEAVLEQAAQWLNHSGDDLSLLFVLDDPPQTEGLTVSKKNDHRDRDFWRRMNQLRESWDALAAQVVFLLLPANYRLLSLHADHLKRWISLKIHLLGDESQSATQNRSQSMVVAMLDLMSPDVARAQLRRLEGTLAEAIHKGASQAELARRYYFPMLAAAMSLHDLGRAKALRDKIDDNVIAASDRLHWLSLNTVLSLSLFDLDAAKRFAEARHDLAEQADDMHEKARTYHQLGRIAQEQRDFATAQAWYQQSLAIFEKQGDKHGAASTYHNLGTIAQEQQDFATAQAWYQQSMAIKEKQGDEHAAASTYHQLGTIAEEQPDFASAGEWFLKAITLFAKVNDPHHHLGIAMKSYARNLRTADEPTQAALRQRWQAAGLDQLVPPDELKIHLNSE